MAPTDDTPAVRALVEKVRAELTGMSSWTAQSEATLALDRANVRRAITALGIPLPTLAALADGRWQAVPGIGQGTDEMAHAMSRLDGYDRDRDMPTLQRWLDYWDAALAAAPRTPEEK